MKRQFYVVLVAGFLATGLAGCGAKERQELQQKVAGLEQQLVKANSELAEKEASVAELRNRAVAAQSTIDAQASKLAKVQVERDKLKQEVAQLKKKKRG
jgi:peptidoglycan hydrolase CwlO-like protein